MHVAPLLSPAAPGGSIHSLLSDPSLTWVGCGWDNSDQLLMEEAFGAAIPPAVLDVQEAARAAGWRRVGLQNLVIDLMGIIEFKKPHKLTMYNWASASLSLKQARRLRCLHLLRLRCHFPALPRGPCSLCY